MAKDKETPAQDKTAEPVATAEKDALERDFSYTQNREASWLRFDARVLDEAFDEAVPLFERLKFVEIFGSNLDEWFMIRVGGLSDLALLKKEPRDNKSGMTPSEQLEMIFETLPAMVERHEEALALVEGQLAKKGLVRVGAGEFTDADLAVVAKHFDAQLSPIISPLVVDPRHPFPNLHQGHLYVACALAGSGQSGLLGVIEVPAGADRVIELAASAKTYRYTLVEDVLLACLDKAFSGYTPKKGAVLRVTRNADVDPDGEGIEEEEDYRDHMKKVLKRRLRLQPVRLEIEGSLDKKLESLIIRDLALSERRVFHVNKPLDLSYVYGLESKIPDYSHAELVFQPFEPQNSPMVDLTRPMREQVEDHDVLLLYPYESMNPLLRLVREASADDACISIKVTLYRVAKSSHLCESLIAAAENGKDVTVLMELRARFDEANNIAWAERLEDAGCTVIYGSEGFKCHSKILQVTYHDASGLKRITCLGTGNFNEKTARLYSDFMLLTAHEGIGEDGNAFFRNLSLGNLRGSYNYLGVAPAGLKPLVMRGIEREIERAQAGQPAQVFMKMNSLTDRDVIDKINEAVGAGVHVIMIIRGICCIKDVDGSNAGFEVRQIVGRFLEHARIYAFGADIDTVYLSSADMMTRNTERRVEIAYPVLDASCRSAVVQYINLQLADNVKARTLTSDGTWGAIATDAEAPAINSQEVLLAYAYQRARRAAGQSDGLTPFSRSITGITAEQAEAILDLPSIASYEDAAESVAANVAAPEPAPAAAPEPSAPRAELAAPAPRKGRFAAAFELIGRGLKTLFVGTDGDE